MRWILGMAVAAVFLVGPLARAEPPGDADGQAVARQQIQGLSSAARKLRRISQKVENSGGQGSYADWLTASSERIDTLAKRWTAGLDLYYREFPAESLAAEPDRAAHAARWLDEKNAEFADQVKELQGELLEANAGFSGVRPIYAGRARAVLDGLGK